MDLQAVDLKSLIAPMEEVQGNTPSDPEDPDSAVLVFIKEKRRGKKVRSKVKVGVGPSYDVDI